MVTRPILAERPFSAMGAVLGVSAVAVGKILELLGYGLNKCLTESAVAAECGVRRWDGYALPHDWHLDRVVSAIRSTVEGTGKPAVADALAAVSTNRTLESES